MQTSFPGTGECFLSSAYLSIHVIANETEKRIIFAIKIYM